MAERETLTGSLKDYVYFASRLLYSPAGTVYRDRLGSARVTGTPTSGYTTRNYYPFGEEIGSTTASNQCKFADTYRDSTSGLDYALARYYPSTMGRFLGSDPGPSDFRTPQSLNRYSYAWNDPRNLKDPDGMSPTDTSTNCPPGYIQVWGTAPVFRGPELRELTVDVLGQFPGLSYVQAASIARVIMLGGAVVCVGSGVCEIAAVVLEGVIAGVLLYEAASWLYARADRSDPAWREYYEDIDECKKLTDKAVRARCYESALERRAYDKKVSRVISRPS